MDSSNSGSFQSSSGGAGGGDNTEEYDSRTQSISSFLNPPTANFNHLLHQQPPSSSSSHLHHQYRPPPSDTTFFDPSSASSFSNSQNLNQTSNHLHDLGSVWTGPIRPDRNLSDFGAYNINPNPSTMDPNTKPVRGSDHLHQVTMKNPKKRTRASRRAPTTVLTTDTTNFRQMVQEFTGIPTAPFTAAASGNPYSRRLDLFGRGGDGGIASLYPLRPSAQKIQQQPPPFLNSTANIIESGTSNNITAATTSSNYHVPPSNIHDIQKQPTNLIDMQNPMLSFQSLLQTTLNQQQNHLTGFPSSSTKRWRGHDDKLESLEGLVGNTQNIGGSKLNSGLENASRNSGDQVQGNEDSWICPSS